VVILLWPEEFSKSNISFFIYYTLVAINFLLVLFGVDKSHVRPIISNRSKSSASQTLSTTNTISPVPTGTTIKTTINTSALSNFSRLTFWYLNDLVVRGNRGALCPSDLIPIEGNCLDETLIQTVQTAWTSTSRAYFEQLRVKQLKANKKLDKRKSLANTTDLTEMQQLNNNYNKTIKSGKELYESQRKTVVQRPLLALCVLKMFAGEFVAGAALKCARDVFLFLGPYVLARLISYVQSENPSRAVGLFWALCMSLLFFAQALVFNQYFDRMFKLGARIRSSLTDLVYKQSLRLSNTARRNTAQGHLVNLIAVNAQSLNEFPHYLNAAWSCLANIVVCIVILGRILNPAAAIAGFITMLVFVPLNSVCTNRSKQKQTEKLKIQDLRLKNISEILNGIKIIKFMAWERSYEKIVGRVRQAELIILKYISLLNAVQSFSWIVSPFLVSLVSFSIYLFSSDKNVLDAQTAFTSLAIFNLLKQPLAMLPMTISNIIQAHVSFNRLQDFLLSETIDPEMVSHENRPGQCVTLEDCTFGWSHDQPVLRDISFKAATGTLTASKSIIKLNSFSSQKLIFFTLNVLLNLLLLFFIIIN